MYTADFTHLTPENRAKAERFFLRQMSAQTRRMERECAMPQPADEQEEPYEDGLVSNDEIHRNIEILTKLLCVSRVTRASNGDYEYETPMSEEARKSVSRVLASNVDLLLIEKVQ